MLYNVKIITKTFVRVFCNRKISIFYPNNCVNCSNNLVMRQPFWFDCLKLNCMQSNVLCRLYFYYRKPFVSYIPTFHDWYIFKKNSVKYKTTESIENTGFYRVLQTSRGLHKRSITVNITQAPSGLHPHTTPKHYPPQNPQSPPTPITEDRPTQHRKMLETKPWGN